jgi:hypothetical protein
MRKAATTKEQLVEIDRQLRRDNTEQSVDLYLRGIGILNLYEFFSVDENRRFIDVNCNL